MRRWFFFFFFADEGNKSRLSLSCPPLAGRGNSASIITSSYIFSLPVSLMFFFFSFPSSFDLLITLCTQPTQIKEQLQSRSRKLELKGLSLSLSLSLSFHLLLSPRFSTLLFKQLRPSRGAERGDVLPEPGRSLFTFPFLFFPLSSQQSAGARVPLEATAGLRSTGKGPVPESGDS